MIQYSFLEYIFIFDATSTWQHVYQFEKDLSDFFGAHGFDAQVINTVTGAQGRKLILIKRLDIPQSVGETAGPGRPKQPGSQFKDLSKRNLRQPAYKFMGKNFKKETK